MIELYSWGTPNGDKIAIALEELQLTWTLKPVNIGRGEQFQPEFLQLSPNNRIPAIVDTQGPDGKRISVFESGAILQYLARKTGKLCGRNERERVEVEQWIMWQSSGLGPMSGQARHFLSYAPSLLPAQDIPYAKDRYRKEVARLYSVLDKRLADRDFIAGDFLSIADIGIWPWISDWKILEQALDDKPNLSRWLHTLSTRQSFITGKSVGKDLRTEAMKDKEAQRNLFGSH
ncbi:glutathione S-transferase family protein [Methylophaga sp.]|uniref:glutathione S-transferase family protein n=1 Tax=Methylophaga sp. TaxID=2024840 RepID=UPI003A95AA71